MRAKVAKKLRKFAKIDASTLPWLNYRDAVSGQEYKAVQGLPTNKTRVLDTCQRAYYQQLKKVWNKYAMPS